MKYTKAGDTFSLKIWPASSAEPQDWHLVVQNDYVSAVDTDPRTLLFRHYEINNGTVSRGTWLSGFRFTKSVPVTGMEDITLHNASKVALSGSYTANDIFDGKEYPVLAKPKTLSYAVTKGAGKVTVSSDGYVSGVNGSTYRKGDTAQVAVCYSSADGTLYIPVDVNLCPPAIVGNAAYYSFYLGTRKVTDGGTLTLGGADASPISMIGQANNKTYTVTGEGEILWDGNWYVAMPTEDDEESCGYTTGDATLIFEDAVLTNANPGETSKGFEVYHTNNHSDAADKTKAYLGTMKIRRL